MITNMWNLFGATVKAILFLLGLVGLVTLPEDAQKWAELMGPLNEYIALNRAEVALFIGVTVFGLWILFPAVTPLVREIRQFFKQHDQRRFNTEKPRTIVTQDALDELSRLRADGINKYFAVKPIDAADFGRWDMGYHQWEESIKEHLETHFPEADYLRFCNLGRVQIIPFDDGMIYSPEHLRLVRLMSKQLDIIEEFLKTYRGK